LLALDVSGLPSALGYRPGQFAQLRVPGAESWRSYSFTHADGSGAEAEFLIRLLPQGAMSDWLRDGAKPGDRVKLRAPKGDFYLRGTARPVVLVAGGTGLSAILAMAEELVARGCPQPVRLNYGVTRADDLVLLDRIQRLAAAHPNFSFETIVAEPSADWSGRTGFVTDLLDGTDLRDGDVDIYLCGPSAMIDATRAWLDTRNLNNANLYYEKFLPSGASSARSAAPVPAALGRLGLDTPETEEDHINCFYSTMQHSVPPERAWRDRVMTICYAHRPYQRYYAAQYFTDSSRSVLATSLVGYNFYSPPRNETEFRAFARQMPTPEIGTEIDGIEPCSQVFNFRYPTMQRWHYEDMKTLPAGLVSIGDAYCSADPVSGAGMTKALLELGELRKLLRKGQIHNKRFVRRYYRRISRIADLVWSVIREQNLRYPWIPDVEKKRPFYFRAQNWYIDRVLEAIHDDPAIYRKYLMVTHFVATPSVLMRPDVTARVLWKWLASRLRGRPTLVERNFGQQEIELRQGSLRTGDL